MVAAARSSSSAASSWPQVIRVTSQIGPEPGEYDTGDAVGIAAGTAPSGAAPRSAGCATQAVQHNTKNSHMRPSIPKPLAEIAVAIGAPALLIARARRTRRSSSRHGADAADSGADCGASAGISEDPADNCPPGQRRERRLRVGWALPHYRAAVIRKIAMI